LPRRSTLARRIEDALSVADDTAVLTTTAE